MYTFQYCMWLMSDVRLTMYYIMWCSEICNIYISYIHWWFSTIPRLDILSGDVEEDHFIVIAANIVDCKHRIRITGGKAKINHSLSTQLCRLVWGWPVTGITCPHNVMFQCCANV